MHDGNQHGVRANRALHVIRIKDAARTGAHVGYADAKFFRGLRGVEDRVVLDRRGDDVPGRRAGRQDDAEDRSVIRLRASAGEDDFAGPCMDELRNLLASFLHRVPCLLAEPMDGGGVAEVRGQIGHHRLDHFRRDLCRCVIVQINPCHGCFRIPGRAIEMSVSIPPQFRLADHRR